MANTRIGFYDMQKNRDQIFDANFLQAINAGDATVKSLNIFKVKSGGSQSQLGVITLSDDTQYFIKQVKKSRMNDVMQEQREADSRITDNLGDAAKTSPFVMMKHGFDINGGKNQIIVFPKIEASQLIDLPDSSKPTALQELGSAMSNYYLEGIKQGGGLEEFYSSKAGDLTRARILRHDDFQPSNVMVTPDYKIHLVDTEGARVAKSDASYENLKVALTEMTKSSNPETQAANEKAFLTGFASNFPPEHQRNVMGKFFDNLSKDQQQQYGKAFDSVKLPASREKIPDKAAYAKSDPAQAEAAAAKPEAAKPAAKKTWSRPPAAEEPQNTAPRPSGPGRR